MENSKETSDSSSAIKRRRRLLPQESDFLIKVFEHYPRPTAAMREMLATKLGMTPRGIQIWFQNRRAKIKRDLIESGKTMLLFAPVTGFFPTMDLFPRPMDTESLTSMSANSTSPLMDPFQEGDLNLELEKLLDTTELGKLENLYMFDNQDYSK